MGIYYHPEQPPIVPDAFLSLGVERFYDEELRPSYVLWEEQVVPGFVLEVVSVTPGREYTSKLDEYARMGVLYYVIYNSKRRRKAKLEIHKLVNGKYQLQECNPLWMPEIGLGIGYERGEYGGLTRDWLYWYTEDNQRYPTPAEQIEQNRQEAIRFQREMLQVQQEASQAQQEASQAQLQADRERQRSDKLAAKLRSLGVDPDVE
jgi:hypothetical protein